MTITDVVKVWVCLTRPIDKETRIAKSCEMCEFVDYCDDLIRLVRKHTAETTDGVRKTLQGIED